MTLLLDTHTFIWWSEDSDRLGKAARKALSSPDASVWLSSASAWEMAIKSGNGRLVMKKPLDEHVSIMLNRGLRPVLVNIQHALAVQNLPAHHSDPFDRILIAQAQCENMTLVTADPAMAAYKVRTLDASK